MCVRVCACVRACVCACVCVVLDKNFCMYTIGIATVYPLPLSPISMQSQEVDTDRDGKNDILHLNISLRDLDSSVQAVRAIMFFQLQFSVSSCDV